MHATFPLLQKTDFPAIRRKAIDTLQVNLGYLCNQSCQHCHVNAGPTRTELMDAATIDIVLQVLKVLHAQRPQTLDLTGGAPEMNPHFRTLVRQARALGVRVIDRCNLTILFEPGHEDLAEFLASEQVEVTASLPCYSEENVDRQRGSGVFDKSIAALQRLNALGYGQPGSGLVLNLVYNPQGPSLPPGQPALQADYQRRLAADFAITFNQLYVLANMPIQRFGSMLVSKGTFASYMALLKQNYSAANLASVMCRSLVSVDWRGYLYDCDFNQMLALPMRTSGTSATSGPPGTAGNVGNASTASAHLRDLLALDVTGLPIVVADHCYGCTAGQGSSCGGALAA